MTTAIAVIGKSGSGKTTFSKALLNYLNGEYPEKSVLLVDCDLTGELSTSFGVDINDTIWNIRTGDFKYKTQLPYVMTKQEYIDWTLQETLISLHGETDLIVAGPLLTKECSCFAGGLINSALAKLLSGYDFVIFDSEFDLEYLRNLTAYPVDTAVIISLPTSDGIFTSFKIKQSSLLNCAPGQIGLILNKVQNSALPIEVSNLCDEYDIDILGILPFDETLQNNAVSRVSPLLDQKVRELVYRLNLPKI